MKEEERKNYRKGKRILKETSCGNDGVVEKSYDFSTTSLKTLRVSNISTRVIQEQPSLWMLHFFSLGDNYVPRDRSFMQRNYSK